MFIRKSLVAAALTAMVTPGVVHAQATEPYISETIIVPYNFCPRGYVEANGQLISIASNTALFALIGTTYGGNGVTTFALPDLRGRTIVHNGQGPGLTPRTRGEAYGQVAVTLTTANLPPHSHTSAMRAYALAANTGDPGGNSIARTRSTKNFFSATDPNVDMRDGDVVVSATGGGQAVSKESPYLAMRHCIATVGVFPPRP